jgi:ribosomal protein S12 methylthiotransferase
MHSFHLVSLGCAKNLVDSEVIIGSMATRGWQLVNSAEDADILIINTCGFIQAAVEEAIDEIFQLAKVKNTFPDKRLVVVGCLVQRYKEKLAEDLPEVDLFVGTEGAAQIATLIEKLDKGEILQRVILPESFLMSSETPRVLATPSFRAWLKITEGCNNHCSYCMIPMIRGGLRSRSLDDLVHEARNLERYGVKELSLIAQDCTAYGRDLDENPKLESLVQQLLDRTTIPWLRLLYLYPTGISDALLNLMANNKRLVPYLDIPMQHVNDNMLQVMNRRYNASQLSRIVDNIRNKVPDVALRTTFLVGFPGESEKAFLEIEKFMREFHIDHAGVFAYANEEGSASEKFLNQVPEKIKRKRVEYLLAVQAEISAQRLKKYVGRIEPVLVEGLSSETDLLLQGRSRYQAPEVDGCVLINEGNASPGDIVSVAITDAQVYDLVGRIVVQ